MEKQVEERIQEWAEMAKVISDLYIKIISLEQKGKLDETYYSLKSLLPKAIEMEQKKFASIDINYHNVNAIRVKINKTPDYETDVLYGILQRFDEIRMRNKFEQSVLYDHDGFASNSVSIMQFLTELASDPYRHDMITEQKYSYEVFNRVKNNQVAIIQRIINNLNKRTTIDYLIYLKYQLIATIPRYEQAYLTFHQNLLPITDIMVDFPELPTFDKKRLKEQIRVDVEAAILKNINTMVKIDDFSIENYNNCIYYSLSLSIAQLVSINDLEYIDRVEKEIESLLPTGVFYTQIRKLIETAFEDAKELVKNNPYQLKKNG